MNTHDDFSNALIRIEAYLVMIVGMIPFAFDRTLYTRLFALVCAIGAMYSVWPTLIKRDDKQTAVRVITKDTDKISEAP